MCSGISQLFPAGRGHQQGPPVEPLWPQSPEEGKAGVGSHQLVPTQEPLGCSHGHAGVLQNAGAALGPELGTH